VKDGLIIDKNRGAESCDLSASCSHPFTRFGYSWCCRSLILRLLGVAADGLGGFLVLQALDGEYGGRRGELNNLLS
jgi:hypothetical protein